MTDRQLPAPARLGNVTIEKVVACLRQHGVVLKINADPWGLDLDWRLAPGLPLDLGSMLGVDPDAHSMPPARPHALGCRDRAGRTVSPPGPCSSTPCLFRNPRDCLRQKQLARSLGGLMSRPDALFIGGRCSSRSPPITVPASQRPARDQIPLLEGPWRRRRRARGPMSDTVVRPPPAPRTRCSNSST